MGVALPGQHGRTSTPPGREPGAGDEALGRSRGGFTIHVRCEGYGKPVTFALTEVHDSQRVTALIDRGAIRRIGRPSWLATKAIAAGASGSPCASAASPR